ncbi:MAG: hypothetical protein M1399_06305 [Actinobacteria bacterium]|nr:hypothetical protein [Actinomycetota bacterium]MCL5446210.1 hypothetical protein [Actinomycetota bacterium]
MPPPAYDLVFPTAKGSSKGTDFFRTERPSFMSFARRSTHSKSKVAVLVAFLSVAVHFACPLPPQIHPWDLPDQPRK